MRLLICGGAGYIGSHIAKIARESGHAVTVVDNLATGHRESIAGLQFHQGDIGDSHFMTTLLRDGAFDLVMHFCAFSLVGDSVQDPATYYLNNVGQTLALLDAMRQTGHNRLVFSSTAAVYGVPRQDRIDEDHDKQPINPYGRSKWMIEQILQDYASAYGLNSVSLRYFNAAGADPSGCLGEYHQPETHLIPNILKSVASGGDLALKVFGTDYPTPDGSCIRDYIHVSDLASAHLLAGDYLRDHPGSHAFNLGIGHGFSVLDVIQAAMDVTGQPVTYDVAPRRPGDPPILVADASRARRILAWEPHYTDIRAIIDTAWTWHRNGEHFKAW